MTTRFSWLSYLDVAELLVRQRGEAFYRSALSRAYYAAFGHIRDNLQRFRDAPFSTGSDVHQQVIAVLLNDQRPQVKDLGERLHKLRRERNRADYQARARFVASRARSALAEARRIRDGIAAFFPNS